MPPHLPHSGLVVARGRDLHAQVEIARRDDLVDHVWISMDCGLPSPVLVSVNTLSTKSREVGIDPRVRVGVVRGECRYLPGPGFSVMESFDYAAIERTNNVFYEALERGEMETLLLEHSSKADLLEAWGVAYRRKGQEGIHQVHSRRASGAVPEDVRGSDGGLKFFTRRGEAVEWVMLLMKFFGQP